MGPGLKILTFQRFDGIGSPVKFAGYWDETGTQMNNFPIIGLDLDCPTWEAGELELGWGQN